MLTHARLRELLSYDYVTGEFVWLSYRGPSARKGDIAGRTDSNGHRQITIDGKAYLAHRLAWLYMTEEWPVGELDHKNRIKEDNSWENLRPSTRSKNTVNTIYKPPTKSGTRGVYTRPGLIGWYATITVHGEKKYLGSYSTIEEASMAYKKAAEKFFGEFLPSDYNKEEEIKKTTRRADSAGKKPLTPAEAIDIDP